MGRRNYLIDGVSGAGKTTVATALERLGYPAIHGDRELKYRGNPETGEPLISDEIAMNLEVIEDYEICYPNPLNLKAGDQIQLFEKDVPKKWLGWNWCKDSTGKEGWISETYFDRSEDKGVLVKDYTAKEISVTNGEKVDLIFEDCGWAWCKKENGDQGWLPTEVLKEFDKTKLLEKFKIVPFDETKHRDLLDELTAMLHAAYRPLAQKGMRYLATHQPAEITLNRLKKGDSFLGFLGERLVSTITVVKEDPNEPCGWYRRPEVFFFTQFAVRPGLQGLGIGSLLMDYIESYAKENGAHEIALDTSEHAHHLISTYSKRNYRFVEYAQWNVTNYRSVILSKNLTGVRFEQTLPPIHRSEVNF
ncbi:MAG: GNAT family N-acetyltransferase [Bdellovibrionales bacterium]|nr:GNAT family N-acetyltransferase [Bdellovibrionales bacterium]